MNQRVTHSCITVCKNKILNFIIMKAIVIISILVVLSGLGRTQTQQEIQDYFNQVAYGSDETPGEKANKITKWYSDIKIFLDGNYTSQDITTIKNLLNELNPLIAPLKMTIVKNKSESNSIVYFGDFKTFNSRHLDNSNAYINCNGYCLIYGFDEITIITNTKIFIRTGTSALDKKHAIIEEITQSLGLANDSWTYEDSMFYEGYSTTQQLSKIDKEVIKMLYTDSYAKRD
ncbi:MAG: DUF2927 domain-containing protein [Bacteroidetes bacterium]|nr:DUF2927 domain-containing protein [Bacteroidota bacterium]